MISISKASKQKAYKNGADLLRRLSYIIEITFTLFLYPTLLSNVLKTTDSFRAIS